MRRSTLVAWIIFLAGVGLVAWYYFATVPGSEPQVVNDAPGESGGTQIEITIAGEANGDVVIELFDTLAPQHAERIATLAREGAYDGVVFHRVIDGFMAQTGDVQFGLEGGDMRRAGTGGSDYPDLPAEFSEEPFVQGVVGMARSSNPNSANSQFFIMFDEGAFLNGEYTVVGRVIEGMDVVMNIKRGEGPNGAVIGAPDVMTNVEVLD
ncbi:MAG: peptidylprolyl isomerase [Pseudomonadota bacterium]|nr:peptidylprolyl isomerase [Pseudomonadota bacterium]